MNDDFFGPQEYDEEPRKGRDHLFLWTVGILILIGATLTIWLGSFYVFGHPEKPESYRILQKLGKLDPPQRFELTEAPAGKFFSPEKAFEYFSAMSRYELSRENEGLLRDYINNFRSTKRLVPYLTGRFTIMSSYDLTPENFFGSGVVAVAQSVDFPQVLIEHVYTAPAKTVPVLRRMLAPGLDIKLEKMSDLAAVLHVERLADGRLQFTVAPLLYGAYALKQGSGSFSLEPPASLNPAGGLPIIRGPLMEDCLKAYAEAVRARRVRVAGMPGMPPPIPVAVPAAETTIVRVATPTPAATPASGALAAASPTPSSPAIPPGGEPPEPEVPPLSAPAPAAPVAQTAPLPTPETEAEATPSPTPAGIASTDAEPTPAATPLLQPFLVSAATPAPGSPGATWRTYAPGQMPRGRLLGLSDAVELADRGLGGERLYLRGSFIVTAARDNRAVLRSNGTLGGVLGGGKAQATRVIVTYPAGTHAPRERETFSRDEMRPFEIRDVKRGSDGQLNIYVREVTNPS